MGIAATERHGGSRIREITTQARIAGTGRWLLTGEKCWVSRLTEATGFVAFFRDPDGQISAAIIDARGAGLEREVTEPSGLGGWSWGTLRLHDVPVEVDKQLLGAPGEGLAIFHRHFTAFRPLVTATALGTAASVHQHVLSALATRRQAGILARIRDNALITLGRTHAEILAELTAVLTAGRLAANNHPLADLIARSGKAAGADTANRVVAHLAPLIGAAGYQRAHPVAKARADLAGLLYADGIHDSLYRSAGQALLQRVPMDATVPALVNLRAA
ncbi:acyl-CoA dehydrogenase family protein [Cryptosporangium sp. NPDC051539]|uniref:acyl-CoA dehydrogenase family protein n=1 Tax=Cryptosporangium sp. NPDC051539 TaxID=3363962 RepID=UPI0037B8E23D